MLRISKVFVSACPLVCMLYLQHQRKIWKRFLIDWFLMGTPNGFTGPRGPQRGIRGSLPGPEYGSGASCCTERFR